MQKKKLRPWNQGQALVVLLVFTTVAMMVSLAAATLSAYSINNSSNSELSTLAQDIAVSGMENAILRLLRDTTYAGETLTVSQGTATITVQGASTKIITSVGRYGQFVWTIQAQGVYADGVLTVGDWVDLF